MKTTKKIVSVILAMCMLVSTAVVSSFAAKRWNLACFIWLCKRQFLHKAAENIDAEYAYTVDDLGITYTKDATTFKVWSPTATDVKVNIYTTGSDDEKGASKIGTFTLEKMLVNGEWNGVWTITLIGEWKDLYYTYTITTTDTTHMGSDVTKLMKHRMLIQKQLA